MRLAYPCERIRTRSGAGVIEWPIPHDRCSLDGGRHRVGFQPGRSRRAMGGAGRQGRLVVAILCTLKFTLVKK